jgi:anti-sigma regulatory factor (Ser/Thr protein kinase)
VSSSPGAPTPQPSASERYRLVLPTDLSRVGEAVDTIAACCFAVHRPTRRTQFRLCTIVAEAIANAMTYGNREDPALRVIIELELRAHEIRIGVSDEGDGFDPEAISPPLGDDALGATNGRGLFLIRRLADDVKFNERGNTIWMTLPRT